MAKFAVLNQKNDVINVIVADTKEDAELLTGLICIEYTQENPAGIGDNWNGFTFKTPPIFLPDEPKVNTTDN